MSTNEYFIKNKEVLLNSIVSNNHEKLISIQSKYPGIDKGDSYILLLLNLGYNQKEIEMLLEIDSNKIEELREYKP